MPDLGTLISKWWKQVLLLMIITLAATTLTVFLLPKKYLGMSTALPAPGYSADKTGVFGQNLQTLYPALGTADDLDMIVGTAHLDTVYKSVVIQLKLADYYHFNASDENKISNAALLLKKRSSVYKSDYGELKVKAWDGDRNRAAEMANAIMEQLQQIHRQVQSANNSAMLTKLNIAYEDKKKTFQMITDSILDTSNAGQIELLTTQKKSYQAQIEQYEKLIGEYELMIEAKPDALVITERAAPNQYPDKPKRLQIILAAFFFSFLFGILLAVILEKRKLYPRPQHINISFSKNLLRFGGFVFNYRNHRCRHFAYLVVVDSHHCTLFLRRLAGLENYFLPPSFFASLVGRI